MLMFVVCVVSSMIVVVMVMLVILKCRICDVIYGFVMYE